MAMVPVTDISKWQGIVDFGKMRRAGVQGVIIRLGNGVSLDSMAATYVAGARGAGLVVGGYWFMNPKATATGAEQGRRLVDRARALGVLDIPPMLDIESYTAEPGSYPVLRGQALLNWQCDAAEMVRQMAGYSPIVYTNKAYTDSQGIPDVGELGQCPLIVARYPWYYEGNPQPPADATVWESWLYANTTKRPQVPVGFDGWQGWQFSAGFNKRGAAFGASSTDLDLNLIKADAWAAWLGAGGVLPARPDSLPDAPTPDAPTPSPVPQETDMPCIILGRGQVALLDAGYTTGISAATLNKSTLPALSLADDEWDNVVANSDRKKAADAAAGNGPTVTPNGMTVPTDWTGTVTLSAKK